MLDSGGDIFGPAKGYLGLDINSDSDADLASGEICIAIGWANSVRHPPGRPGTAFTTSRSR